jgi:hypothetical protein
VGDSKVLAVAVRDDDRRCGLGAAVLASDDQRNIDLNAVLLMQFAL